MAQKKAKASDRKTEVLSLRVDPRVKYGLELLARLQRRSTTGVVEWAIQKAFEAELFMDGPTYDQQENLADALPYLWHINEVERLVALGTSNSLLLTFEESARWKVLHDTNLFWSSSARDDFQAFRWGLLLPMWDRIEPLVQERAVAKIVRGLNEDDLAMEGIIIPPAKQTHQRPKSDELPF